MSEKCMSAAELKRRNDPKGYCPLESDEQQALFSWTRLMEGKHPELKLLYAIPNGGLRNMPEAVRFTKEGVRRGVPDMCLPVARGKYHGLYIELKRIRGGKVSPEQEEWIERLNRQGYRAAVCRGFDEAKKTIEEYMKMGKKGGEVV